MCHVLIIEVQAATHTYIRSHMCTCLCVYTCIHIYTCMFSHSANRGCVYDHMHKVYNLCVHTMHTLAVSLRLTESQSCAPMFTQTLREGLEQMHALVKQKGQCGNIHALMSVTLCWRPPAYAMNNRPIDNNNCHVCTCMCPARPMILEHQSGVWVTQLTLKLSPA